MSSNARHNPPSRSNTTGLDHTPGTPSNLRRTYTPSGSGSDISSRSLPSNHPHEDEDDSKANMPLAGPSTATESTALLRDTLNIREHAHDGPCNHGTFSPRPISPTSLHSSQGDDEHSPSDSDSGRRGKESGKNDWRRTWASKIKSKKMSTTSALAERHGVKHTWFM
jgi:hypothetical protein